MARFKASFAVLILLLAQYHCEKRPDRVDVCIVVDTNEKYGQRLTDAVKVIDSLIEKISISPSTSRLMLITATPEVKVQIHLNSCTNRECIQADLRKIRRYTPRRTFSHHGFSAAKTTLNLASKLLEKQGHPDAKKYIVWIKRGRPTLRTMAYLRKRFAQKNVVVLTGRIRRRKGGPMYLKLGFLLHKGYSRRSKSQYPFLKGSFVRCERPGPVYDECNRKCACKEGKMADCKRVRKEFTEMTLKERRRFINAFKTLASEPRYKRRYEDYVKIHVMYFFKGIHTQDYFLPWHRWYMLTFENMLREVDCRVSIPYWDWAFWSNVSWKENVHIWNSLDYGLGGDGDPKRGFCVQDGPFKEGSFKTPNFDNEGMVLNAIAYATEKLEARSMTTPNKSGCLRRSFNGKPLGVPEIRRILKNRAESFSVFEELVRVSLHNSMHNDIGGHMCSSFASVAPEFYLHHTFLDKLWFQWQQHSKACLNAKFSNSHGKMSKFACPFAQSDMMNSEDLPGHVKVIYTDYYYHYKEGGRPTGSKVSKGQQKKTQGTVRVHDVGLSYQEIGKRAHEAFANDDLSLGYSSDDPLGENELGDHSENKFGDGVYDTKGGIASLQYAAKDSIVNNQPKKYKESWKVGEDSTRNEYCRSKDKSKLESKFVPPYEKICYKNYIDKVLGY